MSDAAVAELFELAIAAEQAAEELYLGLAEKFAHHPEVADFWRAYAQEEAAHARWLERLRDNLEADKLAAPADPTMLSNARRLRQSSVARALAGVGNLEDAYQMASEAENAETNMIFDFLVTSFAADPRNRTFLRNQIGEHVGRLVHEFPMRYKSVVVRRSTPAQ
ncbi:MAG: hypothetical protein KKA73_17740 [Chloroflexi bacterium]|nr:hypothetical protein [Chloroflexota bacterium]MBU1749531.1 hypothetical protein [Chloroflexota bacterium]